MMGICISPWEDAQQIQFVNKFVWQQWKESLLSDCMEQWTTYRNLGKKNHPLWKVNKGKVRKRIRVVVVVGLFLLFGFFAGCVPGCSHDTLKVLIDFPKYFCL